MTNPDSSLTDHVYVHPNHIVEIDPTTRSYLLRDDVHDWVQENVVGEWYIVVEYNETCPIGQRLRMRLQFNEEADAAHYIIRWAGG